jgi:hypothetical protein
MPKISVLLTQLALGSIGQAGFPVKQGEMLEANKLE